MTSQVDYVRKTQETLGSVIKKPPLTEKLLLKPPFRFLHDIVTSVARANPSLLAGVYDQNELDWQLVNDRDKKVAFLQKLIDKLKSLGYETNAKPSKIVAGQEPEKTNDLLRQLALAVKGASQQTKNAETKRTTSKEKIKTKPNEAKVIENGQDGQEATSSAGSNKENNVKSKKAPEPEKSASKEKPVAKSTSRERKPKEASDVKAHAPSKKPVADPEIATISRTKGSVVPTTKSKEKSVPKEEVDRKKVHPKSETPMVNGVKNEPTIPKAPDQNNQKSVYVEKSESPRNQAIATSSNNLQNEVQMDDKLMNSNGKSDIEEKTGKMININNERRKTLTINESSQRSIVSAIETRVDQSENVNDELYIPRPGSVLRQTVSARPSSSATRTVRPPTASRREPIVRGLSRTELANYEGPSKRTTAKNNEINIVNMASSADIQVIAENSNGTFDNKTDEDFIINQDDTDLAENFGMNSSDQTENLVSDEAEHGQLVRKILETKKDLENQIDVEKLAATSASIIYDPNEKEKTRKECSKLQENVQQLTKNTLLLSKLAEYLRDDVESMFGELKQWKSEYKKNMDEIKRQMGKNNDEKEILQKKLSDLNERFADQLDSAAATRGRLFKNQEKIFKMINASIKR
uniref:TRAF3-interacting protein 1 n=1 Tax=Romanomermis culicivorax TaxID=13658 RepID=A0A915K3M5_ROMCU